MASYNHLPIFQVAYRLALELQKTTHNFSREQKFALGQKIKETSFELMDWINSRSEKKLSLEKARAALERLKIQIRLSYDLKLINSKGHEHLFRIIDDLGRQLGGWEKWVSK